MNNKGFTLVETLIASTVFLIVTGIAIMFSVAAVKQVEINTKTASSLAGLVPMVELMQEEMSQSALSYTGFIEVPGQLADAYLPPLDLDGAVDMIDVRPESVEFRINVGYTSNSFPIWGPRIRYVLIPHRGEEAGYPNGVDDNGNGFVDEMIFARDDLSDAAPPIPINTGVLFPPVAHPEFPAGRVWPVEFSPVGNPPGGTTPTPMDHNIRISIIYMEDTDLLKRMETSVTVQQLIAPPPPSGP